MQNNQTFLIVDGHNLLFQMFFGMPSKIRGKDGKYIQGVIGFIGALRRIIDEVNPTHLLVVFDSETGGKRADVDVNYKANRIDYSNVEEENNPFSQLPLIHECLKSLNIKYREIPNVEADDVIASYAMHYENKIKIVISSFDTDYYQLVDDDVIIYKYRGKKSQFITTDFILEKLKVHPSNYTDYKSLVGDKADNIKGVHSIGPVTASKLIRKFDSLQKMFDNIDLIENIKIKELLKSNKDLIIKNYHLIKLTKMKDLIEDLSHFSYTNTPFKTMDVLRKIDIA